MPKQILIAPNAFKGSLSAIEVASTIRLALDYFGENIKCESAPIADGGDGTIDVLNYYFKKSKFVNCIVSDPIMRRINSGWLLLDQETSVIELARASGLSLLEKDELNPMWANTFGTGQLILSALDKGCKKIILGLGGSATVDAGTGILTALGVRVYNKNKKEVKPGGGFLSLIDFLDFKHLDKRVFNTTFHVLCDVKIPLFGEKGTVFNFSAQKGAKEGEKILLENGVKNFSYVVKKHTQNSFESELMVGSAGGVAFSMKALLGASLYSGFTYIANMVSLEEKIKSCDLVVTGEGKLDLQTLMGKAVFELAQLAKKHGKAVIAFCGDYDENINWSSNNITCVIKVKPEHSTLQESMRGAENFIQSAVKNNYKLFKNC